MNLLDFKRLNPFLVKMTILITIFICSFFFTKIDYFDYILRFFVFIVLIGTILIKVIKDIINKRGFTKNFDVFFSSMVFVFIGYMISSIIMLIIYEFIVFFDNKNHYGKVCVIRKKSNILLDLEHVKVGDVLVFNFKDKVIIKGELLTESAHFIIDGESVLKVKGEEILEGSICLENNVSIKASNKYKYSIAKRTNEVISLYDSTKYKSFSKFLLVIGLILIFIPNLFTGKIQKHLIIIGASLLLIKDMDIFSKIEISNLRNVIEKLFKNGILFNDLDVLSKLVKIKNVIFEKTGVLTLGEFRVTDFDTSNSSEFFKYLNYGEFNSNHRIAGAIRNYKSVKVDGKKIKRFKEYPQRGVECIVDDKHIIIGNGYFLKDKGIDFEKCYDVGTIVYVAVNKKYIGNLVISDSIKSNTKDVITCLKNNGIKTLTLLSGDSEKIVNVIAHTVGIKDKYSNLTNYEKLFWTKHLKEYYNGDFLIVGSSDTSSEFLKLGELSLILTKDNDMNNFNADIYITNNCLENMSVLFITVKKWYNKNKYIKLSLLFLKLMWFFISLFGIVCPWLILLVEWLYFLYVEKINFER